MEGLTLSKIKNVQEFGYIFLQKYAQPSSLCFSSSAVETAFEVKNWEVAKYFSIIYYWYYKSYNAAPPKEENFWSDLQSNFEQTIKQYEAKHTLNWPKLLHALHKVMKDRDSGANSWLKRILRILLDNNEITLNESIPKLKIFFTIFDLGGKFEEKQIPHYDKKSKTVIEYSESLEYYIATTKEICKSDRVRILKFLAKRGAITLKPSGPNKISTPFELAKKRNISALTPFLSHPEIHKLRDAEGKNILHYLAQYYPYLTYFKNFKLDQLKYMLKQRVDYSAKWLRKINQTPMDMMETSYIRGLYPSIYFQAIKELILEGELKDCDFLNRSTECLGPFGPYFLAHLGVKNDNIAPVWTMHAKSLRKEKKSEDHNTLISPGDTTFAFDLLPVEIGHIICIELDHESYRSLLSVSKSIFSLKNKFSDAMYNEFVRKTFPTNTNYNIKGRQGYFDLARRYTNWQKGTYNVRYIKYTNESIQSEPSFKTLDENWLSFQSDRKFMLWDCHSDRFHELKGLNPDATISLKYLESHPGEIPVVVSFSTDAYSIVVNGRSAQKVIKNATIIGRGGLFAEVIDSDRVFLGGPGNVWSIEKEAMVGQLHVESYSMVHGSLNPLNNLIFTKLRSNVLDSDRQITVFDKNLQKVISIAANDFEGFRFVDEHTIVVTNYNGSSVWDLRKPEKLSEFLKTRIDRTYCGRYALDSNADKRQAVIWDLKTSQWETTIILPDGVRYQPICNSRYVCWQMFYQPTFCLLDFQTFTSQ